MALNSDCTGFHNPAWITTIKVSIRNYMRAVLEIIYMTVIASFTVLSHMHDETKECDWKLCLLSEIKFYISYAKSNDEGKII